MNSIQAFIDYWNNFIYNWYKNPIPYFISNVNPWQYQIANLLPDANALPEPYCGDPNNFSAIILNLNPGGVTPNLQKHPNGLFIQGFMSTGTYWHFAQTFPYLTNYKASGGGIWWTRRDEWIKRLCASNNRPSQKNPFAIDICPWHSKSWGGFVSSPATVTYVNDFVIKPAEIILNNADIKTILCVGKTFTSIFQSLNFKQLQLSLGPNMKIQNWPKKMNGNDIQRYYSIWESPTGIIYINTYSPGTNSAPSSDFTKIELDILQFIKISGYNI